MVKFGIAFYVVFFVSTSHTTLITRYVNSQLFEYSIDLVTDFIKETNKSITEQYDSTIQIVDDLLTTKLSESIAAVDNDLTAAVTATEEIIDWEISFAVDPTNASECAKLKDKLARLRNAASVGVKKCAEKLSLERRKNITKAEIEAVEKMSKLMNDLAVCRDNLSSLGRVLTVPSCIFNIKSATKTTLLDTPKDVGRTVDIFRDSLEDFHEDISNCKESNNDLKIFDTLVKDALEITRSCMGSP